MTEKSTKIECNIKGLHSAIENYAKSYKALQIIQEANLSEIPKGDQKTGVIGENIGIQILKKEIFKDNKVELCENHSQKDFDAIVTKDGKIEYIQIKTVSGLSKNGYTSTFKKCFTINKDGKVKNEKINGLLIVYLNLNENENLTSGSYIFYDDVEDFKDNAQIATKNKFKYKGTHFKLENTN